MRLLTCATLCVALAAPSASLIATGCGGSGNGSSGTTSGGDGHGGGGANTSTTTVSTSTGSGGATTASASSGTGGVLLEPTGAPCTADADCAPSVAGPDTTPGCLQMGAGGAVFENGYCSSPCRLGHTDIDGLNFDCPSDSATCMPTSQTTGLCVKACSDAAADCRVAEGYACLHTTPDSAAACFPKDASWCDPKMPMSCPKAMDGNDQTCINDSPDDSYGRCVELCDVFLQDCPQAACLADPSTGVATCSVEGWSSEGDPCADSSECASGLTCHDEGVMRVCRAYCREGSEIDGGAASDGGAVTGDHPCPGGQSCVDISAQLEKSKLGVCTP